MVWTPLEGVRANCARRLPYPFLFSFSIPTTSVRQLLLVILFIDCHQFSSLVSSVLFKNVPAIEIVMLKLAYTENSTLFRPKIFPLPVSKARLFIR